MNSTLRSGRTIRAASATCRPFTPPGRPTSVISRSMRASDCRIFSPDGLKSATSGQPSRTLLPGS